MYTQSLQHMYQAWQQGNPDYIQDWYRFVQLATKWLGVNEDEIMQTLSKCRWFHRRS